jgi:hypothetical protein
MPYCIKGVSISISEIAGFGSSSPETGNIDIIIIIRQN